MEQILIVGAGPTGLALACTLRQHGATCRVIDRRAVHIDRARAVDLQPRTLEALRALGLFDDVLARGTRIEAMSFYDGARRLARLGVAAPSASIPFGVALPQNDTEELLETLLLGLGGKVERGIRLVELHRRPGGVNVGLLHPDGNLERAQPTWVVGCDGATSSVRDAAGIEFTGRGGQRSFATTDVSLDWNLPAAEIALFLGEIGFLLVLPLPGNRRYRLIAETADPRRRPDDLDSFAELARELTGAPIELHDARFVLTYHVNQRLARNFQADHVLLAGDAAHTFNPVGGHGMNQGIQDATNLGWKLALVARGLSPGDLLATYDSERRAAASVLMREMDFSARLRLSQAQLDDVDRDRLLDFAVSAPPLRRSVLDAALTYEWTYSSNTFVREVLSGGAILPSGLAPGYRAPALGPDGDDHGDPRHTLLLFAGDRVEPGAPVPGPRSRPGVERSGARGRGRHQRGGAHGLGRTHAARSGPRPARSLRRPPTVQLPGSTRRTHRLPLVPGLTRSGARLRARTVPLRLSRHSAGSFTARGRSNHMRPGPPMRPATSPAAASSPQ